MRTVTRHVKRPTRFLAALIVLLGAISLATLVYLLELQVELEESRQPEPRPLLTNSAPTTSNPPDKKTEPLVESKKSSWAQILMNAFRSSSGKVTPADCFAI